MNKRLMILLFFIPVTLTFGWSQEVKVKPNIVFILADDLGYGSVNAYGASEELVRTPNINLLAREGMRFTNAHTPASICTPTRYGFLTGSYPWRSSLKFGVTNPIDPLLPDTEAVTIADMLKKEGYRTAAIGKWHLGYGEEPLDYTKSMSPGPLDLGFDYHFGVPQNHGDMLGVFIENDHIYGLRSGKKEVYSRTFYGSRYIGYDAPQRVNKDVMEELTEKSVDWIKQQNTDQPFFLYFAAVAVHHPITPSDYMRGLSDCGPYGDFIQDLDRSVGEILSTLEYMGLMENTIVIFSSDNGGEIPGNRPEAPENTAVRYGLKINSDFRGDKHTIYQGGTRVPFIVKWPGEIEEGSSSESLICLMDLYATVADIVSDGLPEDKSIAPDSYSFYPNLFSIKNKNARETLVTADASGMHAIQSNSWKYIDNTIPEGMPEERAKRLENFAQQLYDLEADPSEVNDLMEEKPEKAAAMRSELNKIRTVKYTRK